MSEKIEVKIQLDKRIYGALEWYLKQTSFWVSNDDREASLSEYVGYILGEWLEMEAGNPEDAVTAIKTEMKLLLDLT